MPSPVDDSREGSLSPTLDYIQVNDDILYVDELSLCSNASTEESIDLDPTWEDVVNKPVEAVEMQARSTTDRCVGPTPPIHRVFKNPSWLSMAYITAIMLILFGRIDEIADRNLLSSAGKGSPDLLRMPSPQRSACEVLRAHINISELVINHDNLGDDDDRLLWNTKNLGIAGAWKLKSLLDEVFHFPPDVLKWQSMPKNVRQWRDGWNIELNCSLDGLLTRPSEVGYSQLGILISEVAVAAGQTKAVRNFVSKSLIRLASIISPEAEMQCGYNDRTEALKMSAFAWKRKYGWKV